MASPIDFAIKMDKYNVLRALDISLNREDTTLSHLCLLEIHFPNANHSQAYLKKSYSIKALD